MPAPLDCPEIDSWQALLDDAVPPDERERYERHLESCPACQERLDRAEDCPGALRRLGWRVGDPTTTPPDPTLARILEQLHQGKHPSPATPGEAADLYFLRPSEQPGVLGTLGEYEVLEVVGQGGMGVVLKAFEPALNRFVAVKVLAAAVAGSATARARFTREARAAAAVCHDHVVAVHGVGETDGLPYLVMQYVAGESLQERLDRDGPLPAEEAVRIGHQTASGLAAAHAQGLIHRDIKPANLLLENGVARVKITDFGLARMADDVGLTRDGVVAGTPEYMAPEQARGEPVDPRADLFSLGSVLYACCAGRPPFRGPSAVAVLKRVCEEGPPPLRSLNPAVPGWLEALVSRLLSKEPAERFQTAAEVAALLEGYLAHLRNPAAVPAPALPPPPGRPARRPRKLFPLLALALLAAAGLIALRPHKDGGQAPGADDGRNGAVRRLRGHTGPVHNLQFTADGRLVSGSGWPDGDRTLRVWDPATGRQLLGVATAGQVLALDLAPDGRRALAGLDNGRVLYLDLDTGDMLLHLQAHRGPVGWVGFAPDGKHAFSAAHDGTARLWDLDDGGRELRRFSVEGKWANCGAVSPDGRRLITGDDRGLLQVWDVATGQELQRMEAGMALGLSVLPDGRHALVAGNEASVWDMETGERLRVFEGHDDGVFQAAVSPDGRQVATACFDGKVRLWDFQTAELLRVVGSHDEFVFATAFSPDGRLLASGGGGRHDGDKYLPGSDHDIRLWELAAPADAAAPQQAGGRGWLAVAGVLLLVLALSFAGVWWWARRGRRNGKAPAAAPGKDGQPQPDPAAPTILVACAGCGKNLKARGRLAGKTVKCPHCGHAVTVPAVTAVGAALPLGTPRPL